MVACKQKQVFFVNRQNFILQQATTTLTNQSLQGNQIRTTHKENLVLHTFGMLEEGNSSLSKIIATACRVHSHLINPHISPKLKRQSRIRYAIFQHINIFQRPCLAWDGIGIISFGNNCKHFIDTLYHTLVASSCYMILFSD